MAVRPLGGVSFGRPMDHVVSVRIRNLRCIESLDLDLAPVTVLIGENGSGKSSIIEALELLWRSADPSFLQQFYGIHRGAGVVRVGAQSLSLGVGVRDAEGRKPRLEYDFTLAVEAGGYFVVREERLRQVHGSRSQDVLTRGAGNPAVLDPTANEMRPIGAVASQPGILSLASFGTQPPHEAVGRMREALQRIEVHLAFDTLPTWAANSIQRPQPLRGSVYHQPVEQLALLGHNLANAWSSLKNDFGEAHWQETMELVRLGLGDSIDSVAVRADAGGGNVSLWLQRLDMDGALPAAGLSDGQLTWLAFVALARLHSNRSALAFDEPEVHLHPALLGRVVALLSSLPGGAPVVLGTHSDRILELLDDPAGSVRVCGLARGGKTEVALLDPEELARWRKHYGDLGQLRASGYLHRALRQPAHPEPEAKP